MLAPAYLPIIEEWTIIDAFKYILGSGALGQYCCHALRCIACFHNYLTSRGRSFQGSLGFPGR